MPLSQVAHVERNLKGLSRQVPELPLVESMILRVAAILGRDLNVLLDGLLKPAGLAEAEFRVLMALFSHGGSACAGELCAALAQSPANLTRVGDSLVKRGYVTRSLDAEDRRKMMLSIEPAGERLLRSLLPGISSTVASAFEGFTATGKKRMLADLKRLLAGIDSHNAREIQSRNEVA